MMTRSPGCISLWPAVRVTISRDQRVPGFMPGYRIPSHTILIIISPIIKYVTGEMSHPEKHSSFLHLISGIVIRYILYSLSILPPSLCLSFSLLRRLNALLWQLIHTFAVEEEKQSFWRKTLRALQTQS